MNLQEVQNLHSALYLGTMTSIRNVFSRMIAKQKFINDVGVWPLLYLYQSEPSNVYLQYTFFNTA